MKKRPKHSDSLHSALHGPTGNNSVYSPKDYLNLNQRNPNNPETLDQEEKPTALYLYHYKRFCVDRKKVEKSDACLFDRKKDASQFAYIHQLHSIYINSFAYNYHESIMGALNCLRARMGITEKMDRTGKKKYPPFKILTIR